MREIKFRAWSPSKKKWRADWSISEYTTVLDLNAARIDDDLILCQYTGLKDKNGREIYEGDIVEREGKGFFEVRWEQKCSAFLHDAGDDAWKWQKADYSPIYKVIGNIYENSELIGEVKF